MNQRPLAQLERAELDRMNAAVVAAINARRKWLDAKMEECSQLKVGDDIYDLNSGRRLGKISKLYRFNRDRSEGIYDTSAYCDYEYETTRNCFDNTSRQPGLSFGTLEAAIARADYNAKALRSRINPLGEQP